MNLDNPIQPTIVDPAGVDVNIQSLREQLETLPWIERSFGRAVALYENSENSDIRVPKAPLGKGEYFTCMPNDTQKAFAFFYPVNSLEAIGANEAYATQDFFTQRIDLTIWANLKRISDGDIGLGEKLKAEVISLLNKQPSTVLERVWSDDIKQVYEGWKLDLLGRDLLYYPYYGMRFELKLKVRQNVC